jgi:glycosyltransferase involved in cell wall biosynthesis
MRPARHPDVRVTILLSTYNGAPYLQAQLESFVAQTHRNWVLLWRDDCSTDATLRIMQDFTAKIGAARCIQAPGSGPHMGAALSFLTLLAEASNNGMVAFADQDDVWLPEKLDNAVSRLVPAGEGPALYCARQYLVDEKLASARLSVLYKEPGFPACLTQNVANGNTVVMNEAAAALVATSGYPQGSVHDWWSYIVVASCGGQIIFDEEPQVLYRLHKYNLIARAPSFYPRAWAALQRGPLVYMTMMRRHADMLEGQAGRMAQAARQDLRLIQAGLRGGLWAKLTALSCPRFRRHTLLENLLFSWWFLSAKRAVRPVTQAAWSVAEPKAQPRETV